MENPLSLSNFASSDSSGFKTLVAILVEFNRFLNDFHKFAKVLAVSLSPNSSFNNPIKQMANNGTIIKPSVCSFVKTSIELSILYLCCRI